MTKNHDGFRGMLNGKNAANYVGVHYCTFIKLLNKKTKTPLPHYKIGKIKRFFKAEDLDKWIEQFKVS